MGRAIFHQRRLLSASSSQTLNTSEMGHWQLLWTAYTRYSQHLLKSILPYIQPVSTLFQSKTVAFQGACQGPSGWLPFPQSMPAAPLSLVPPTDLLRVHSVSLSVSSVKIPNHIDPSTDPRGTGIVLPI